MSDDPGSTDPLTISESTDLAKVARRNVGSVEVFVADEQDFVVIDTDRWLRLAVQVLAAQGVSGAGGVDVEMSLYFVDEAAISALNQQFMNKSGPTDVLSFPIDGDLAVAGRFPDNGPKGPSSDEAELGAELDDEEPLMLGDVLICPTVAAQNCAEHESVRHNGSLDDELALLVVHGILHLLGMDHMIDEEAETMEALERDLLDRFHRAIPASDEVGDNNDSDLEGLAEHAQLSERDDEDAGANS